MKAKTLLRISVVPLLVKLLGHSLGHSGWDKPEDPEMQEIVAAMKAYTGEFMGAGYNMAEYYTGYSLMILCVYVMTILIVWFASGFAAEHRNIAARIILPVALFYVVIAVLEFIYFFPFAAIMSVVGSALMLIAVARK